MKTFLLSIVSWLCGFSGEIIDPAIVAAREKEAQERINLLTYALGVAVAVVWNPEIDIPQRIEYCERFARTKLHRMAWKEDCKRAARKPKRKRKACSATS